MGKDIYFTIEIRDGHSQAKWHVVYRWCTRVRTSGDSYPMSHAVWRAARAGIWGSYGESPMQPPTQPMLSDDDVRVYYSREMGDVVIRCLESVLKENTPNNREEEVNKLALMRQVRVACDLVLQVSLPFDFDNRFAGSLDESLKEDGPVMGALRKAVLHTRETDEELSFRLRLVLGKDLLNLVVVYCFEFPADVRFSYSDEDDTASRIRRAEYTGFSSNAR